MSMSAAEPIDAVIPWVDGDDPRHQEKLNEYLKSIGQKPKTASATRFRETGEFEYCIASLIRFAPWIRCIHIVTDGQTPAFMSMIEQSAWRDKIKLVDHKTLFQGFEDCLPTFNSRSIGSVLWRTPGLSERYLFLNDDFMLLRPVMPDDFFRDNKLVIRGKWSLQTGAGVLNSMKRLLMGRWSSSAGAEPKKARPGYRAAQARAAVLADYSWRYWRVPHNPHPMLRSVLAEFFGQHPDKLADNVAYPLRSDKQFLADALCNHLAMRSGKVIRDNRLKTLRLKPYQTSLLGLKTRLAVADLRSNWAFLCIQSMDKAPEAVRRNLFLWLHRRIGRLEDVLS